MSQTIEVTAPDGNVLEIDAPEGASPDQIHQAAIAAASHYKSQATQSPTQTPLQQFGTDLANSKGVLGTANTLLKAPEKMSAQGLNMIAAGGTQLQNAIAQKTGLPIGTEPTGNLTRDVIANTPRIAAETLAKVAPGFISKGAILTAGALRGLKTAAPLIKMIAKGAGSQLESMSGAAPGMTQTAADAPLFNPLQIQPGKKAASSIYEAGKEIGGEISPELTEIPGKIELVQAAIAKAKAGQLNPTEALAARQELDAVKSRVSKLFFRTNKEILDGIAKPVFAEGDTAFKQGLMADSSRQLMPQNKYGGASAFKTGTLALLQKIKNEGGDVGKIVGTTAQLLMSPAAVGLGATVAGDAAAIAKPFINNPIATAEGLQLARKVASGSLPSPILPLPKEPYQLKPDIAALQQGIKREAKTLPNPVIPPTALELTKEKAKEFLKLAKGNKDKARKMALEKGYRIPEVSQ